MQDSIHERNESGSLNYSNAFKKELMNQSGQFNMSGEMMNSDREGGFDIDSVVVRRSDGDDYFAIEKMIDDSTQDALDLIYNYPKLLHLLETSFLSMTILDANLQPMGVMVFNDYPPGLEGMYDYKHENAWELWLDRAYNLKTEYNIRPFNCLWLTFAYLDRYAYKLDSKAEVAIVKKVFQNVYGTFPNVEGISFMLRGESKRELGTTHWLYQSFKSELFQEMECKDREVLKKVRGVHFESILYFSPRDLCLDYVEIRIAKQEDHDDLAAIFNSQSEVLTAQFGEFFIAELIAFQNQDQKALVAQVKDKAVGLMSISKDIDYRLLAESFELDPYDNLLKGDFMDALRYRRLDIVDEEHYAKIDEQRAIQRKIRDEKFRCSLLGQRLALQQYCITKEAELKQQLDDYLTIEEKTKALTKEIVQEIIDKWLEGFKLTQPHEIFYEHGVSDPDIFSWIIGERDFFLETLIYYGLPKDYIHGMGHHKDWARKQLEKKKAEAMRRGPMANKMSKKPAKKRKGQEEKKEEFGPPPYFDLEPFMIAFNRFVASGPQVRAIFRDLMTKNKQTIALLFSNEEGELIHDRIMDIYALPSAIVSQNIALPMADVIPGFLECFGEIKYDLKVSLKNPLEENEKPTFKKVSTKQDKDAKGKKTTKDTKKEPEKEKKQEDKEKEVEPTKEPEKEAPKEEVKEIDLMIAKLTVEASKPVEYYEKFTSYKEIQEALEKITLYDQILCELGIIESPLVQREVDAKLAQEEKELQDEMNRRRRHREENDYDQLMMDVMEKDGFPEIPLSAHNAIVINLFCIDDPYESRSIDFLFYAFEQFPDREYIILTQPHTINESTLLQSFVQVPKKKNSVFEDVLYIFHKDALFASMISVTRTQVEDISNARPLYAYMPNAEEIERDIVEAVKSLTSNNIAFTAHIDETIIGMYVISKDVNLLYYKSHFSIQDFMLIDQHSRAGHAKIVHAILNPIFKKSTRYILKEVMRLSNKTAFYFETTNKTVLPDIFNDLILTRSRKFPHLLERKWDHENDPEYVNKFESDIFAKELFIQLERFMDRKLVVDGERDPYDQKESNFALSIITKKLLSINKVNNNYRIVVVGGSDTGISFVESLLSVRYVNFPHITLLAPGGIHSMHVNSEYTQLKATSPNYTLYELKNLMLDARVTVLDARMTNIDRKKKTIYLDKKAVVPYDVLVLTVGLIDNQLFEFEEEHLVSEGVGRVNEKYEIFEDRRYIKGVYSLDDPYIHDAFSPNAGPGSPIDLLTRRKRVQNIMVYGRSLHCFCFINGLLNRGVKPERINFVIPPRKYEKPTKFESNEQKWEHEDHKVHDPDAFEDPQVEEIVLKVFESMGIKVYPDFYLADIRSDENNNIESIKFRRPESEDDEEPEELEEPCKLLVTSRYYDIDPVIFACIHDNGLVYNGRLIVKSNFQTTDESIFAAGRLCEFSQRYKNTAVGISLKLDKYSSREIGQKLSRCVLEHIGLLAPALEPGQEEEDLPLFFMPVGTCGVLPNDLFYYYIRKIDWAKPKKAFLQDTVTRKDLVCNNLDKQFRGHYIKFTFDSYGIIDSVTYLGTERISVQSLSSFVGLAETYLNQLTSRYDKGLIPNVTEFLSENWAMALYHEWFSLFRHQIKLEMSTKESVEKLFKKLSKKAKQGKYTKLEGWKKYQQALEADVIKAIEDGTLDFIRENLNHLPMYYIPGEEFP